MDIIFVRHLLSSVYPTPCAHACASSVLGNKQTPPSPPRSPPPSCERTRLASSPHPQASPASVFRRALASPAEPRPPPSASTAERRPPLSPHPPSAASPRPPSAVRRSRLARQAPSAALASPVKRRPSTRLGGCHPPSAVRREARAPCPARPACQPEPCTADHQRHSSLDTRAPAAPSPRHRALGHRPTAPLPLGLSDRRFSSDQTRRVESLKIRAAGPAALNRRSSHGLQKQSRTAASRSPLFLSWTLAPAFQHPTPSGRSAPELPSFCPCVGVWSF
ncbi:hypothetical protein BDA96_10G201200 [Sorghum bicolor]|uniref:Uncharacterized protein n=1 Tax=Sorghum bicolor TaxID=4558 RepID=A0A921Q314_SORBI|nr:hypothetical protein BDA96_10G201200 [Sorghum bicolor]